MKLPIEWAIATMYGVEVVRATTRAEALQVFMSMFASEGMTADEILAIAPRVR